MSAFALVLVVLVGVAENARPGALFLRLTVAVVATGVVEVVATVVAVGVMVVVVGVMVVVVGMTAVG